MKERFYLRDALGRFRPKFGSTRRYTRRAMDEAYDRQLWNRREEQMRQDQVNVFRPDRVNIHFSSPPNRPRGRLRVRRLRSHR